jgi:PTH1 family peptidyl-tRNA hydrolase
VVSRLAAEEQAGFKRAPKGISAEITTVDLAGGRAVLALPFTFMNEAGLAIAPLARYYKVPPDQIVLVHDDIDLPFGRLRFQYARGTGGHNGVASVMRSLGSAEVWRLKVGVGRPPGRIDPADFVLRHFYDHERDDVDLLVVAGAEVLRSFADEGGDEARQQAGEITGRLGLGGHEPR